MASKLKLTELLYPTSTTAAITINSDDSVTIPTQSTTNLAYTGTLTGGTGVVNLGSGQFYKATGGNVGIGTSSPVTKLQILGAAQTTAPTLGAATGGSLYLNNTDANYGLLFGTSSNGSSWIQAQRTDATATAYNIFLNPSGGNVGIGTVSPGTKLEVTGDITQTWAASMDRFVGSKFSTTYELGLHFIESGRETRIVSKAGDGTGLISFYTGVTPTEKMRLDASGNLLVGNTATTGSTANNAIVLGGILKTISGSVSAASGTATTLYTAPSLANGTYIVSVGLNNTAEPAVYSAVSLISVDSTVIQATTLKTATGMTISISGQNVQATQASGITTTIVWTATRVH